jgi:pyrroline-5-carboxylate reductase
MRPVGALGTATAGGCATVDSLRLPNGHHFDFASAAVNCCEQHATNNTPTNARAVFRIAQNLHTTNVFNVPLVDNSSNGGRGVSQKRPRAPRLVPPNGSLRWPSSTSDCRNASSIVVSLPTLTYHGGRKLRNLLAMLAMKIGLMGSGRMATALARGFVDTKTVAAAEILASDPSAQARQAFLSEVPGAMVAEDNARQVAQADVVFLAVKPQQMSVALEALRDELRSDALVVSIAAGIPLERLAAGLAPGQRLVRVMPNTPCLIGQGASGFSLGRHATKADAELVKRLLSAVGIAFEVPEKMLDAVTGLSGSGPAFVYSMIEALTEGGTAAGLPADLAAELAARTAAGAAQMVLATRETPATLRERVTSPGGTTVAGLTVLKERGFQEAVTAAVMAAASRSAELGQSTT